MSENMGTQDFEEIYERYKTMLYRIAFTYLKNNADVEDVLQEVFLKRFYQAPEFANEEHENHWMIRITVNLCKNTLKSFWKKNVDGLEELPGWQDMLVGHRNDRKKEVLEEVMRLPAKQRIAVYLHYYEGYSCKEIANILACKESAVKMRLKKGRDLLKISLEEEGLVCN